MAKKFKIDLYDKRHLNNLLKRAKSVEEMFDEAVKEAARAGAASGFNDPDRPFYIDDFPAVKRRIDELVTQLHDKVVYAIEEGDHEEWLLSCEKNDELVEAMTRSIGIPKEQISQWKQPNLEALSAFQARKINGLGLSDRVWSITEQFKQELELALDIGLGEGKSAADLTREVRRYLNDPERLFRRVRDKHGVLRLSKAAKAYHPGQGVYRSSYKNALRLTATENNIAYRTSDYNRWQQLDFVVGIEIRCSNNHPDYDVCDELKGKYPKDFKFTGWHPFCRCHAVPILKTAEEMAADNERIMKGEPLDGDSVNKVTSVPAAFDQWIADNKERAKGWSSMPYFVQQNPKYIQGFEVDTYSPMERKFTRARRTSEAMRESAGLYVQSLYPEMPTTEKAAIYHYTQGEGAAYRQLNNQLRRGKLSDFNVAFSELLSEALSKLDTTSETVYRTIRLNKTKLRAFIELANKQGSAIFDGFTSSSLSRETALEFAERHTGRKKNETDVLLVIKGKSGHPIEDFSQFGGRYEGKPNQREVLFDKGLKFKFTGYKHSDGSFEFYLTED